MDYLSLVGFVLAAIAIGVGSVLKGAGLTALISGAAFMIVVVGTFAAILVQTPWRVLQRSLRMSVWVLRPPSVDSQAVIRKIVDWSQLARKQGLLGLEPQIDVEPDPFLRKGLQLVVDGTEPEQIRSIMEVELEVREHADLASAKVIEGLGVYAPTLGIIGAVLGLMAVMQHLVEPSKLGAGIAAAFTATVYGIGLANLVFLPAAAKLKTLIADQALIREMMIEGLVAIAEGENPRAIDTRLQGYLST